MLDTLRRAPIRKIHILFYPRSVELSIRKPVECPAVEACIGNFTCELRDHGLNLFRGFTGEPDADSTVTGFATELRKTDGSAVAVSVSLWRCESPRGPDYLEGTVERLAERPRPAAAASAGPPRLP